MNVFVYREIENMKKCSKCKEEFTLDYFPKNRSEKDGHHAYCFDCKRLSNSSSQKRHLDGAGRRNRRYRCRHPDRIKQSQLKRLYNISLDEYQKMYETQQGRCYLCRKEDKVLVVDHDHKTGIVRKLFVSTM